AVPCYGDPTLSDHLAERDLKTRLMPAAVKGQRRPQLSDSEDKENPGVAEPVKVKRTRLSADQRLALSVQN
ncbi:hypothetical protein R3P38DRAFT_2590075, partial [Favolaschia claudopus]